RHSGRNDEVLVEQTTRQPRRADHGQPHGIARRRHRDGGERRRAGGGDGHARSETGDHTDEHRSPPAPGQQGHHRQTDGRVEHHERLRAAEPRGEGAADHGVTGLEGGDECGAEAADRDDEDEEVAPHAGPEPQPCPGGHLDRNLTPSSRRGETGGRDGSSHAAPGYGPGPAAGSAERLGLASTQSRIRSAEGRLPGAPANGRRKRQGMMDGMTPREKSSSRVRMTGSQRREQLVRISRELFASKGFEGTSVEEIAARAKVSKPVVYEHFGGKEGIYAVVVDREVQTLLGMLTEPLSSGGHPKLIVERAALALLDYIEDNTDGFRILVRDSPVAQATGTFSSLIGDVASQVEHLLAEQFRLRRLDPAAAPMYAQMLVGLIALTGQWWLEARQPEKAEVAAHIVHLTWDGLAGRARVPRLSRGAQSRSEERRGDPVDDRWPVPQRPR